jgi:hypothetical protein
MAQHTNDKTGSRFLSWPRIYRERDTHDEISKAIYAFSEFYEGVDTSEPEADWGAFDRTEFARAARAQGYEDVFLPLECMLDFVLVWLVEGNATDVCPTYESYLRFIIGLADQARYATVPFYVGKANLHRATEKSDGFDLFFWGERPSLADYSEDDRNHPDLHHGTTAHRHMEDWRSRNFERSSFEILPKRYGGFNHPALDPMVYAIAVKRNQHCSESEPDL